MNGNNFFVDTNVVIYWLNGDRTLADILNGKQIYVSFISELELLSYSKLSEKEKSLIKNFLTDCNIVDINSSIKSHVIALRQKYNLKLPDSIILASSIYLDIPLITADSDFKRIENINLIFYEQ